MQYKGLAFFCIIAAIYASQGDRDDYFQICRKDCSTATCLTSKISKFGNSFPFWNCDDDCDYDCMQTITAERSKQGYGPLKYYGHWPFLRIFGLEEPASVVFSLLNALPYIRSLIDDYNKYNTESKDSFMDRWLTLYWVISTNTWLASAFFHSRKTKSASFYDYASALLFLGYSFWLAVRRILGANADPKKIVTLFLSSLILYVTQVIRMSVGYVSFDDHMRLCITVAVLNVITWLLWLLVSSKKFELEKHNYRYLCLLCQVWFSLAALLELYDFPAIWGIFDAHSLWHAATVPLGFIWAYFWRVDREILLNEKNE